MWIWCAIAAWAEEPLYVEHCAVCHGKQGHATFAGVMMQAPSFAKERFWADRPEERFRTTIAEGGGAVGLSRAMPAYGDELTPEEIDRLLAAVLSFRPR